MHRVGRNAGKKKKEFEQAMVQTRMTIAHSRYLQHERFASFSLILLLRFGQRFVAAKGVQ